MKLAIALSCLLSACAATSAEHVASTGAALTACPTKAVADDFERATLGTSWAIAVPSGGAQSLVRLIDGSDLGLLAGAPSFLMLDWQADTFSADQYSQGTIPVDVGAGLGSQVYVRHASSLGPRYGFFYQGDPAMPNYGCWALKYDGVQTALTRIIGVSPPSPPPVPGDTLRVEIVGYTLKGYVNGTLVIEATDTGSPQIANGRPGLACRALVYGTGILASDAKMWESFAAGDVP